MNKWRLLLLTVGATISFSAIGSESPNQPDTLTILKSIFGGSEDSNGYDQADVILQAQQNMLTRKLEDYLIKKELYTIQIKEMPPALVKAAMQAAPQLLIEKLKFIRSPQRMRSVQLLFVGEPGTGKSTTAFAMAQILKKKAGYSPKAFDATQMVNKYRGSGEGNLGTAFAPIKYSSPDKKWVVILEEIDKLVAPTQDTWTQFPGAALAFNTIINQLWYNPNIVIIGSTNDSSAFPESLKSRFSEITFQLPDKKTRAKIIKCVLTEFKDSGRFTMKNCLNEDLREFNEDFLKRAAAESYGMSARTIEEALVYIIATINSDKGREEELAFWVDDVPTKKNTTTRESAPRKKEKQKIEEDDEEELEEDKPREKKKTKVPAFKITQQMVINALKSKRPSIWKRRLKALWEFSKPYLKSAGEEIVKCTAERTVIELTKAGLKKDGFLGGAAYYSPYYTEARQESVMELQYADLRLGLQDRLKGRR